MGLSYAQGLGTTPLLGETIAANFDRAVATHGERDALVVRHQDVRMSYAELGEAVDRAARALAALGLAQGRPRRHLGAELRGVGRDASSRPRSSA